MPTNCKMRKETRISPLTNKQIEGFWTLKTEEKEERDLNIILQELISKISKKLPEIKNLCEKNNGEVIFDIVASFDDNSKPDLYFEREFLRLKEMKNEQLFQYSYTICLKCARALDDETWESNLKMLNETN